LATTPSRVR